MSDEIDQIDLSDPDLEKAATKIQATFKGYKARQEVKTGKGEEDEVKPAAPEPPEEEEVSY